MLFKFFLQTLKAYIGYIDLMSLKFIYSDTFFVFLINDDADYSRYAIELLPNFIKKNSRRVKVVISKSDAEIRKLVKNIDNTMVIHIKEKSLSYISILYKYKDVSQDCVFISTKIPYLTGADRMLGVNNITKRDIVFYDMYKLDEED